MSHARMQSLAPFVALLALTACATDKSRPVNPLSDAETITYDVLSLGPFCGPCNSTKLTVSYDGRVWIEQGGYTRKSGSSYSHWKEERRLAQASPDHVAAFRAALDPHRPVGQLKLDEPGACASYSNDLAVFAISWRDHIGVSQLHYDFGCDSNKHFLLQRAIAGAPTLLGIDGVK